uniref:Uncharacterized protein n=1 Tax=Cucumis melo TaxID=3656 RepID=A0A9I9EKF5_CUCME
MHPKFPTSHDPFGIQSSNPFSVQSLRRSDFGGLHSFNFRQFFNFFSSLAFRSASLQGFFILPKGTRHPLLFWTNE